MADESLLLEARHLADREGRTLGSVIHEALAEYVARRRPAKRRFSLTAVGRSGASLSAEEMDDLLKRGVHPTTGWVAAETEPEAAPDEAEAGQSGWAGWAGRVGQTAQTAQTAQPVPRGRSNRSRAAGST